MKEVTYRVILRGVLFILIATVSGCGAGGPIHREWIEDVLLDDGSTIQVKRTVTFNETNSWSGDAYNAVETEAAIAFTGNLADLPPWHAPLMALVLYKDGASNEWVVVATTTSCNTWNRLGEPEPMYWEFRLSELHWREVPLSQTSIARRANLLHRYQSELKKKHITVEDRARLESDPGIGKEFREILAVDKTNCTKSLKH